MEVIYIIIGIYIIGLFFYFSQAKKRSSQYFKIKKKLEDDLLQTKDFGDWKKRQEINLQLLWLKTIKQVESMDIFGKKKEENEVSSLLTQLSEDEIKFTIKWKLDDLRHFPFSQQIIAGYRKCLAENDYSVYKPESILPFPKHVIKKAIYFTFDYLNYDKPLYEIPDKQKRADNLNTLKFILTNNFVDTSQRDLPKEGLENFNVGQQLRKEQPYKEEEDLLLIDWRSDINWIVEAVRYGDQDLFDFALACIEKAKAINPNNKDTKAVEGMLYLYMAEHYEKNNDKKFAYNYMQKAVDLDNKKAMEWLKAKKQLAV